MNKENIKQKLVTYLYNSSFPTNCRNCRYEREEMKCIACQITDMWAISIDKCEELAEDIMKLIGDNYEI